MLANALAAVPDDASFEDALDAFVADACLESFAEFVRHAWPAIHGELEELIWTRCLDAVCQHMQAVAEGRIKKLIIAIPPGFGKSLLVSVFFPAWRWARDGRYQHLAISGLPDLATRDALKCKDLIDSEWYQRTFRPAWHYDPKQDAKTYWRTSEKGVRWSRSVGQKIIGMRPGTPGCITVDDPLDATEAYDDKAGLSRVNNWYRYSLSTRRAVGLIKTPIVIICQRLHEADLPGTLLSTPEGRAQWDYLCIPQQWDGREKVPTSIGWVDWRTVEGEFIDERLYGPEDKAETLVDLTRLGYATQHQQLPAPLEGAIYTKTMIRHWQTLPGPSPWADLMPENPEPTFKWRALVISVDSTFVRTSDSDRAAIGVWGLGRDGIVYFLDLILQKMTPSTLVQRVKGLIRKWEAPGPQKIVTVIVETKSSGKEVINYLTQELIKVTPYNPQGVSKIERVMATLFAWEREPDPLVRIPPIDRCSWVRDKYLPELLAFPQGRHDDAVDQGSQALLWFRNHNLLRGARALVPAGA